MGAPPFANQVWIATPRIVERPNNAGAASIGSAAMIDPDAGPGDSNRNSCLAGPRRNFRQPSRTGVLTNSRNSVDPDVKSSFGKVGEPTPDTTTTWRPQANHERTRSSARDGVFGLYGLPGPRVTLRG